MHKQKPKALITTFIRSLFDEGLLLSTLNHKRVLKKSRITLELLFTLPAFAELEENAK